MEEDANLTRLMAACRECRCEEVEILLRSGREAVNAMSALSRTALEFAVEADCAEAVRLVLAAGGVVADGSPWRFGLALNLLALPSNLPPTVFGSGNISLFVLAVYEGRLLTAPLLYDKFVMPLRDLDRQIVANEALFAAIKSGRQSAFDYVLSLRPDVNVQDLGHSTPLINASAFGYIDMVKALLHLGANINATSEFGSTALMNALEFEHEDIALFLIDSGADVSLHDRDRASAMSISKRKRLTRVIARLKAL